MLTIALLLAFLALAGLDAVRARVLTRASIRLDRLIAGRVMTAMFDRASASGGARSQLLRDFDTFRQFITGRGDSRRLRFALGSDLHPGDFRSSSASRRVCFGSAVLLVLMALLNEILVRPPLTESNEAASRNYSFTEMSLRNWEVVQAMGMIGGLLQALGTRPQSHARAAGHRERSRSDHAEHHPLSSSLHAVGDPRPRRLSGDRAACHGRRDVCCEYPARPCAYSRWSRSLAPGAIWSARATPIVAFVISWRLPPVRDPNLELPRPEGLLTVENLSFAAPGNTSKLILRGVSFRVEAGEVLGRDRTLRGRQVHPGAPDRGGHVTLRRCGAARWRRCVNMAEGKARAAMSATCRRTSNCSPIRWRPISAASSKATTRRSSRPRRWPACTR